MLSHETGQSGHTRYQKKKKKKKKLYSTPNRQMYKLQYLTYQIYNLSNFVRTYMGNSKIKWNFKKNKKLKVELNTVCQWLVVCLKFM